MKKILMLIVLITAISAQAQEPLKINARVDEFTKKTTYEVNQMCTFENSGRAEMVLLPNLDSMYKINFLGAMAINIGCLDNAQIYILFENGEVINKHMFNKFNCDGIAGFKLNKMDWEMLSRERISKVKIANRGKSIIGVPDNPEYFIQLHALLE